MKTTLSRRVVLQGMGAAALTPLLHPAHAANSQLPVRTTGLEHLGTVVPDVTAAGKFYGRVFGPDLYKERDPPLRYYVSLGVGYLALGTRANQPQAFFDHFCALVEDYDAPAMAQQLQSEGLPAGRYGIIPDPDSIGLQLLGVPGGLAKTTEPAGRIVEGEALVKPEHLDHVVLHVSDLEKSLQFYRKFFGHETRGHGSGAHAEFQIANTRLILEPAAAGETPRINRIGINVQRFDRRTVSQQLTQLGAKVAPEVKTDLRFTDPFGLVLELRSV